MSKTPRAVLNALKRSARTCTTEEFKRLLTANSDNPERLKALTKGVSGVGTAFYVRSSNTYSEDRRRKALRNQKLVILCDFYSGTGAFPKMKAPTSRIADPTKVTKPG
jgi:hypothetical protein